MPPVIIKAVTKIRYVLIIKLVLYLLINVCILCLLTLSIVLPFYFYRNKTDKSKLIYSLTEMYRLDKLNLVKNDLHYNWRDIVSVPGAALKAKKIFIASVSLLSALVVYDIFVYTAFAIDGVSVGSVFSDYGFLPLQLFHPAATVSRLIYYLGF